MSKQKSFTDYELPKRTKDIVVIVREIDIIPDDQPSHCTQMVGNGLCMLSATWTCAVCGQWTCDSMHTATEDFKTPDGAWAICEACSKLPPYIREQIYTLHEELNK